MYARHALMWAFGSLMLIGSATMLTRLPFGEGGQTVVFAQHGVDQEETSTATLQPGPIATPTPVEPLPTLPKGSPTPTTTSITPTETRTATPTTLTTPTDTSTATPTTAFPTLPTVAPAARRYVPIVLSEATETVVRCRLESDEIPIGGETTLYLEVHHVTDLYGYQLILYFDPEVVQLSGSKQDDVESGQSAQPPR